jgi:hypothetical protein
MTKVFPARFPGTCVACKNGIVPGQRISWDSVTKATAHETCPAMVAVAAPSVAPTPTPPPTIEIQPLVELAAFLRRARDNGLRAPKVRFLSPTNAEMRLMLHREDDWARPNHIEVVIESGFANRRNRLGFVGPDGKVDGTLRARPDILACLRTIESNPAVAAASYAAFTCRCSFCGLPLTDEGSVRVGYGPICAMNYDLPHIPFGVPILAEVPVPSPEALRTEIVAEARTDDEEEENPNG